MPKKGSRVENIIVSGINGRGELWGTDGTGERYFFDPRTVAPGDEVSALVIGKRKGSIHARPESIRKQSPTRQLPICDHFGTCGGCTLQHIAYGEQLRLKNDFVTNLFEEECAEDGGSFHEPLSAPEPYYFRNKMEFTASRRPWRTEISDEPGQSLGLFVPYSGNKVLDLKECHLQIPVSDRVRLWINAYCNERAIPYYHSTMHEGVLRTVLIRTTKAGDCLVMPIFGINDIASIKEIIEPLCARLASEIQEITSLWYLINTKLNDSYADIEPVHFAGTPYILEDIDGLSFPIGPQTFFQVNPGQTVRMYRRIIDMLQIETTDIVWDLYCGVGTISAFAARLCSRVVGIEAIDQAVVYARENCTRNGIHNAVFIASDMKDLLQPGNIDSIGAPDLVITDPPRAGMHPDACRTLAACGARRILYVSCKPESLKRDLAVLRKTYMLKEVQLVDLMPQSHHGEVLALLEKR